MNCSKSKAERVRRVQYARELIEGGMKVSLAAKLVKLSPSTIHDAMRGRTEYYRNELDEHEKDRLDLLMLDMVDQGETFARIQEATGRENERVRYLKIMQELEVSEVGSPALFKAQG